MGADAVVTDPERESEANPRSETRGDRSTPVVDGQGYRRSPFERDCDRVLYSPYVLRLMGVTQTVRASDKIASHNRYSHSVKVANIALRIANALLDAHPEISKDLDTDVVQAAGLAHDIGHPPFGHVGEESLDRLVLRAHNPDGYEGNAQSFRVIARLAAHHDGLAGGYGLNLTRATARAVLKYPHRRMPGLRKFGAYKEDREALAWALEIGPKGQPYYIKKEGLDEEWARLEGPKADRSLEAEIMDWADDITYAIHDLEDFYRAGILPMNDLTWKAFFLQVLEKLRGSDEGAANVPEVKQPEEMAKALSALEEMINSGELATLEARIRPEERRLIEKGRVDLIAFPENEWNETTALMNARLGEWRSTRIKEFLDNTGAEEVDGHWRLTIGKGAKARVDALKALTRLYVIRRPRLAAQEVGTQAIIESLFRYLHGSVFGKDSFHDEAAKQVRELLPDWLDTQFEDAQRIASPTDLTHASSRWARAVADFISSLTDDQALLLNERLRGRTLGSIADPLPV